MEGNMPQGIASRYWKDQGTRVAEEPVSRTIRERLASWSIRKYNPPWNISIMSSPRGLKYKGSLTHE